MEYTEARDLIRHLSATLSNDLDGLVKGSKAAHKRYCQAIRPVLAGLLGRNPSTLEVESASREQGYEEAVEKYG